MPCIYQDFAEDQSLMYFRFYKMLGCQYKDNYYISTHLKVNKLPQVLENSILTHKHFYVIPENF